MATFSTEPTVYTASINNQLTTTIPQEIVTFLNLQHTNSIIFEVINNQVIIKKADNLENDNK